MTDYGILQLVQDFQTTSVLSLMNNPNTVTTGLASIHTPVTITFNASTYAFVNQVEPAGV